MTTRPDRFRYDSRFAQVVRAYDTWEADLLAVGGGLIQRAQVLGPRLPEASTPERPQWVLYGHAGHAQGTPWCIPVPSHLAPQPGARRAFVYYEEVGNFRVTINRANELEIRNTDGDKVNRLRITQAGGEVVVETPNVRLRVGSDAEELVVETSKKMRVEAGEIVEIACDQIRLGEPASEPVVLGDQLRAYLSALVTIFNTHHHGGGTPPVTPQPSFPAAALSQVTKAK